MNVYMRLNTAREKFHSAEIKKSGHNKFAGYTYFELGDFVTPALKIFKEVGLTSVIRFEQDLATMEIINTDKPEERIQITSPMSEAQLKGCHPVQNLGAVQTYIRRYLWVAALEIVEHDAVDASAGKEVKEVKEVKEEVKEEEKIDNLIAGRYVRDDPKHRLFVDSMADWGGSCTSIGELTELWKANQKTIDDCKKENKTEYKRLIDMFAKFKQNFKED
jgi:hypothetical protein